jgi:ElaB/YqjD/DUF883 family membrane-anchored ribosome-binding protein
MRVHKDHAARRGNSKHTLRSLEDIKDDIHALQAHAFSLAHEIGDVGTDTAREAVSYVNDGIGTLRKSGAEVVGKAEKGIKARPGQSLAIAFGVGLLASFLLSRKG